MSIPDGMLPLVIKVCMRTAPHPSCSMLSYYKVWTPDEPTFEGEGRSIKDAVADLISRKILTGRMGYEVVEDQ